MTAPSVEPPAGLAKAINDAVLAATVGDIPRAQDAIKRAAAFDFPAGIAFACYAWARMAAIAIVGSPELLRECVESGAAAGVQFCALDGGQQLNAEEVDPAVRFVGRMVACAFNEDSEAAMDLWEAVGDEHTGENQLPDFCFTLLQFTAQAIIDHTRGRGG